MRTTRLVLRHPIAVLAVFAAAFVVWLWRDSLPAALPSASESQDQDLFVHHPVPKLVAKRAMLRAGESTDTLARLKPGMTRAEVEELMGAPAAQDVLPATVADGKVTYQIAYGTGSIRVRHAAHPQPAVDGPVSEGHPLVTLEFDATKPGHPLLAVPSAHALN